MISRRDLMKTDILDHVKLLEFILDETQGKSCGINRNGYLPEKIDKGTDMVFMGMGEHNPLDFVPICPNVFHFRNDNVNTEHVIFGKHQPCINNKNGLFILHHHHIQTNFTQTAKGDYFQHDLYFFLRACLKIIGS